MCYANNLPGTSLLLLYLLSDTNTRFDSLTRLRLLDLGYTAPFPREELSFWTQHYCEWPTNYVSSGRRWQRLHQALETGQLVRVLHSLCATYSFIFRTSSAGSWNASCTMPRFRSAFLHVIIKIKHVISLWPFTLLCKIHTYCNYMYAS